jgi:hypothetical protein
LRERFANLHFNLALCPESAIRHTQVSKPAPPSGVENGLPRMSDEQAENNKLSIASTTIQIDLCVGGCEGSLLKMRWAIRPRTV